MTTTNVNRKLIFPSNTIPNIEKNVEKIIYLNRDSLFISDEYYDLIDFIEDNNINHINFDINNTQKNTIIN